MGDAEPNNSNKRTGPETTVYRPPIFRQHPRSLLMLRVTSSRIMGNIPLVVLRMEEGTYLLTYLLRRSLLACVREKMKWSFYSTEYQIWQQAETSPTAGDEHLRSSPAHSSPISELYGALNHWN